MAVARYAYWPIERRCWSSTICEHLIDASARLVESILASAAQIRILVTSRIALRIAGEVRQPVGPLGSPSPSRDVTVEELERYAATRLFVERAVAVQPNLNITNRTASAVALICERLDGIPLALELAAARVTVLSPEQIADRLDDRFQILTTGSRTAVPRQQTLEATLDWSYQLLPPSEQHLFQRMAVFAGGWTLEAAEAIACVETSSAQVLEGLANLADQSLIVVDEDGGQRRYRMLETLRNYALKRLMETGESRRVQRVHLEFYLELAERSDSQQPGNDSQPGLSQLAREYDNLRLALGWSLDHDPERALRLAACLADFWRRAGYHTEGRHWLELVVLRTGAQQRSADAFGRVLLGAGLLAGDAGEFGPDQLAQAKVAVHLLNEANNGRALNYALIHLGRCIMENGGPLEQVQHVFEQSLEVAQSIDYEHGIGFSLANLAHLRWCQGDHAAALLMGADALRHVRASGDLLYTGLLLGLLGWYSMVEGSLDKARAYKREGLEILRSLGSREALGLALLGMAHLERQAGDTGQLVCLLEESAALLRVTSSPGLADWLTFVGVLQIERGVYSAGVRLLATGECDGPRFGALRGLLYPASRELIDASLATARTALGESVFQAAWADGKSCNLLQAVAASLPLLTGTQTEFARGQSPARG
jgi:predicted ATPase